MDDEDEDEDGDEDEEEEEEEEEEEDDGTWGKERAVFLPPPVWFSTVTTSAIWPPACLSATPGDQGHRVGAQSTFACRTVDGRHLREGRQAPHPAGRLRCAHLTLDHPRGRRTAAAAAATHAEEVVAQPTQCWGRGRGRAAAAAEVAEKVAEQVADAGVRRRRRRWRRPALKHITTAATAAAAAATAAAAASFIVVLALVAGLVFVLSIAVLPLVAFVAFVVRARQLHNHEL